MTNELYNKVRTVISLALSAFAVLFAVWVWQDFSHRMTEFNCSSKPVIVNQYDTIWAIVTRNCSGNISVAVDTAVETYGTNIQVGQQIHLPSNENCTLRITDGGQVFEEC